MMPLLILGCFLNEPNKSTINSNIWFDHIQSTNPLVHLISIFNCFKRIPLRCSNRNDNNAYCASLESVIKSIGHGVQECMIVPKK